MADADQRLCAPRPINSNGAKSPPRRADGHRSQLFYPRQQRSGRTAHYGPGTRYPEASHRGTVAPNEVEHLAAGQRVNIRLTAYKAHRVPVFTGQLTYVGGDRQMDANNQPFFLVRAAIDPDALRDKPGLFSYLACRPTS